MGLSRNYADAGKIKEKLQPAIDELEHIGFLKPLGRDDRYSRIDRGQWSIRLTRQSPALPAPRPQPAAPAAVEPEPPLVAELVSRGVTRATAAELVRQHPAERIAAEARRVRLAGGEARQAAWPRARPDTSSSRSPTITPPPKGFVAEGASESGEEADRRAQERRPGRGSPPRAGAGGPRPGQAAGGGRLSRARLTLAERKALEAEALARAEPEARQCYEEAPGRLRATVLLNLVREHVAQELLRKAVPAET